MTHLNVKVFLVCIHKKSPMLKIMKVLTIAFFFLSFCPFEMLELEVSYVYNIVIQSVTNSNR